MQVWSTSGFSPLSLLLASTLLTGSPVAAATLNWINPSAGDWFDQGNWDGGEVPSSADTAIVNNGGVAEASGASTPTASALAVGAGGGSNSGTVTTTGDFALGGSLQVGVATASEAVAVGMLTVGGDVRDVAASGAFGGYTIGAASGENAKAEGSASVAGDMVGSTGVVGRAVAGKGASANGTLAVGGDLTGLRSVGVAQQTAEGGVASGGVVVETGDLTPGPVFFEVGVNFAAGAVAAGAVTVERGDIRTAPGSWIVGFAQAGEATGQLTAVGVDSADFPLESLLVGNASGGGDAKGTLTLGAGDLRLLGSALIGVVTSADGATASGGATLDGAMVAEGVNSVLRVGGATGSSLQTQAGEATGALSAAGLTGFRTVLTGFATDANGFATLADGTLAIGAGGIVNAGDLAGDLRIGVASTPVQNLSVTGPGPIARASATVGGDIAGYRAVEVGVTQNAGKATGALALDGGTLTTEFLDIGRADPADPAQTLFDATASARGTLSVTDGAVVVNDRFPGSPGFTRIGVVTALGENLEATAEGALMLTRSTFDGGVLLLGRGEGSDGSLTAVDSTIVVGVMEVAAQRGAGRVTLTDSALTVTADPMRGLPGFLGLSGRDTVLTAIDSDIIIDTNLVVARDTFPEASTARMAMTGGTLATGQNIFIGDFPSDSRGELSLTDATATVGGDLVVGRSANLGALFGEALLHLDGGFMDVTGDLNLLFGGNLSFGVGGLDRGLGGYGAIDAAAANVFGGATVDFAGLIGPLGFQTAQFDLIAATSGFAGDFSLVSILNVPTGYSASHAFAADSSGDVWRVTLTRDVAPIPLPAGAWLLLSGLVGLGVMRGVRTR